jgi:hypothetical protein
MLQVGPAGHDNIPANRDNLETWELTPFAATLTPFAWHDLGHFDIVGTGE